MGIQGQERVERWMLWAIAIMLGVLFLCKFAVAAEAEYIYIDESFDTTGNIIVIDEWPRRIMVDDGSREICTTDLLEQCLEFIEDGNKDLLSSVTTTTLEYHPITSLGSANSAVERAKREVEKIERETKLHKDIKAVLKALRKERMP